MSLFAEDWLNFLLRFAHLVAGISWIGSSFYFMWLDASLTPPKDGDPKVEGELWMTHSGGFYQVLRKRIGPGSMPEVLHWFKYEALFTWIFGTILLTLMYYMTGGAYLVDPAVAEISAGTATTIGVGLLVVTWFAYDALWLTIGKSKPGLATTISVAAVAALAYFLCEVFSGRGAYIHLGAIFGTIMVANVWVRILPAQQKMVDATKEGRTPDFAHSGYAKRRSTHNSYMTFPVLFVMLSNHYPMTYGNERSWIVLLLLVIFGMALRHVMIGKTAAARKWAVAPTLAAMAAMFLMTAKPGATGATEHAQAAAGAAPVTFERVQAVITSRCVVCHAQSPVDGTFGPMPGGVSFESPERIVSLAERIRIRAVETKTMPLANKTGMTDEERALLSQWIAQGAKADGGK